MIKFKNKGSFKVAPDKQFLAWIKKTLPDYPRIFDYGCGYGGWTNLISSLKCSKVDVDDVDDAALNFTKNLLGQRYEKEELQDVNYIILFAVLELFDEDGQKDILKKMKDKMKGDKRFIIQYNLYHLLSIRWILMGIRSWGSAKHYHERHKFNRSYLNYKQVESLFNEVGLKVEDWSAPTLFRGLKVSSRIVKNKLFLALSFTI